jgi:tripartite-type tricarboxylate transporter receptor subunit TctC
MTIATTLRRAAATAAAVAGLSVTLSPGAALAQADYPSRPITIVVPYGPGSSTDNTARPVALALTKAFGKTVIVDNKAGANGVIGTQFGARARPDGYTLLVGSSTTLAANVGLFKALPYDPQKDFQAVAGLGSTSMMFMVRSDFSEKDLKSFLAYAAKQPNPVPVAYGSSSAQVALALLTKASGVKFTPVPYKGTPQAITDLLGGQVPMAIVDVGNGVPHLRAGKALALAVSAATRSTAAPDVPTMAETWSGTQLVTWIGLVAPAGTPLPIVEKLNNAITAALATPEVKQQFAIVVTEVEPVSHQDLTRRMQRDQVQWLELIKAAGIQPE